VLYQLYHTHIIHISYTYHTRIIHIIHISYTTYAYHTHIIHNICMHRVACTHRSASLRQLRNTHTHTHTYTHRERAIDKLWCCILHTSYTHHSQHMHASRCMHAQVSQPEAAQKHTHTHTHTQSNRYGVVLYHTHIIHNTCRVGQNPIYAPYTTVCMVISLLKIPYLQCIYL
jgi:hypothetical protein